VYEKDMKTTAEQNSHYRCLFCIPEYQTQTAFVSHAQPIWHNTKFTLGNRNPPVGSSTFQSRRKEGKVTVTNKHFYRSTRNHSKTSCSQLLAELLRRNKLCCTALCCWSQFLFFLSF